QSFTHENAQVARERRLRIVDRLVLAHHAAQFLGQRAGARFECGVREHFVGLNGDRTWHRGKREQRNEETERLHGEPYSADERAALLRAGLGAPTRKRRSESDSAPPITITTAPSQMSKTNAL